MNSIGILSMPTLISSLFFLAAIAQEPPAQLNLGEQWTVDMQSQASAELQSRSLNAVGGDPLLIWLSTTGPVCSITAAGLPESGTFLETVHVLPYSPQANGETIELRVEPGTAGTVVLRVAKLESVVQYARQQWPSYEQALPVEALRGLLEGADLRLEAHIAKNQNPNGTVPPPPWLRGFIQLLQSKQIAAEGRGIMREWWGELLASEFKLSATLELQIQEAIGALYQADGKMMRALLQYRTTAIQAKQSDNKKQMTSALNRLEAIAQDLPTPQAIYSNLADLAGMELTTPTLAFLLAEAQWEMGLLEEAQHNLWMVQKSLTPNQRLGNHCRVHNLLGSVAMDLGQWKMARWHLEQAVEAGRYYLRDTPPTTSSHQEIKVVLAEVFARQAKVLDTAMEPADADASLASALRTLPHRGGTQARLLTLEIAAQMALQRGRISSAKSNLLKAEEVLADAPEVEGDWRGQRSLKERMTNLAALTVDLAWAGAPGGRGKSVWSGLAAVDRWQTGKFTSDWGASTLVRDLPEEVAIVQYARGLQHLYAFRTDSTGVMMWRLGELEPLQKRWTEFHDQLEHSGDGFALKRYLKESYDMYDKLLRPLVMKTDKQLWISLAAEMQGLPLSALANRPGQAYGKVKNLAEASLVVQTLAIAYVDSMNRADRIWSRILDPRQEQQNPALIFQQTQLSKMAQNPSPHAWINIEYPGN
jgi:hypothetical protein